MPKKLEVRLWVMHNHQANEISLISSDGHNCLKVAMPHALFHQLWVLKFGASVFYIYSLKHVYMCVNTWGYYDMHHFWAYISEIRVSFHMEIHDI